MVARSIFVALSAFVLSAFFATWDRPALAGAHASGGDAAAIIQKAIDDDRRPG